jgi:putative ATP-dependent endonuclease of OLD family
VTAARLRRFFVKNFKSIPADGVEVVFRDRLVILVGKNNSGKSNLLEGLGLLFGSKNPRYLHLEPEAFNNPAKPIVLEAEFEGLDWGKGAAIGLSETQCGMLTKSGKGTEAGHLTLRLTVPAFDGEGTAGQGSETTSEDEQEPRQTFEFLLANRNDVKKNEEFRKALVTYILVPPVRAEKDVLSPSGWTAYGRLLRDILSDSADKDQVAALIRNASARLRDILATEASILSKAAKSTAFVDAVDFRLTEDGDPVELLRNLSLAVTFAGRTDDISAVGTGTQSAVMISVLELCLRHKARRGLRLFVVEEPELFLHPHAQRHVARLLRDIGADPDSQVLITTHSPSLLASVNILDVARLDRSASGATTCHRISPSLPGIEKIERILTEHTCEVLFADRVVLAEGASEAELLPRLAVAATAGDPALAGGFDRANVSVVSVGGKDHFPVFSGLLDQLGIGWRILADGDALVGSSLAAYRKLAGVDGPTETETVRRSLLNIGVAVLRKGEVEDYYPVEALAAIKGCVPGDVSASIQEHRVSYDTPAVDKVLAAVIRDHRSEISTIDDTRLLKLVPVWHSQSLETLRKQGAAAPRERKTGEAIESWLGMPKTLVAIRVGRWFEEDAARVPDDLRKLVSWLLADSGTSDPRHREKK